MPISIPHQTLQVRGHSWYSISRTGPFFIRRGPAIASQASTLAEHVSLHVGICLHQDTVFSGRGLIQSAVDKEVSAVASEVSAVSSTLSAVSNELTAVNNELCAVGSELSAVGSEVSAVSNELSALVPLSSGAQPFIPQYWGWHVGPLLHGDIACIIAAKSFTAASLPPPPNHCYPGTVCFPSPISLQR